MHDSGTAATGVSVRACEHAYSSVHLTGDVCLTCPQAYDATIAAIRTPVPEPDLGEAWKV
eukprot:6192097-Pleurochrysis_carterae.AAC.1